jgi:hypothetical protein
MACFLAFSRKSLLLNQSSPYRLIDVKAIIGCLKSQRRAEILLEKGMNSVIVSCSSSEAVLNLRY